MYANSLHVFLSRRDSWKVLISFHCTEHSLESSAAGLEVIYSVVSQQQMSPVLMDTPLVKHRIDKSLRRSSNSAKGMAQQNANKGAF